MEDQVDKVDPIHQFQIQELVGIPLAGHNLSFTNSALWMVLAALASIIFLSLAMRSREPIPGRAQMMAELLYEFVGRMVHDNIGKEGRKYFPLVFTLFVFILMGNLLGLIPHSFTYTSHLIVTGVLALTIFTIVIVAGLMRHGFHFFSLFVPPGVPAPMLLVIVPIEMLSFFVRPITLSVRLFANMMAGHIVLKVFAGFSVALVGLGLGGVFASIVPVLFNVALLLLETLIAFLQAYVFVLLTCIYLKDTIEIDH